MTTRRNDSRELAAVMRGMATAAAAAIRRDEAVTDQLRAFLIATGSVSSTLDLITSLPSTLDRVAATAGEIIEAMLADMIRQDDQHLGDIRRFLLEPQESYVLEELATLWRISHDDVRAIYHDELLEWTGQEPLRIRWANAVATTISFNLFRPFDIEMAVAGALDRARSAKWRTIPVLIRVPRVIAERLRTQPHPNGDHATLAVHAERFIMESFYAEFRRAFLANAATGQDARL